MATTLTKYEALRRRTLDVLQRATGSESICRVGGLPRHGDETQHRDDIHHTSSRSALGGSAAVVTHRATVSLSLGGKLINGGTAPYKQVTINRYSFLLRHINKTPAHASK